MFLLITFCCEVFKWFILGPFLFILDPLKEITIILIVYFSEIRTRIIRLEGKPRLPQWTKIYLFGYNLQLESDLDV